ncbi:MAG: SUMF1/EgtB/PvdO family nonheme iron enzyme [Ardenticatenaceae bacterium]|nr:SUMF1/EgtB/PvdO family nonheme iron enzyme [Ardenticatenaceae bacterium]
MTETTSFAYHTGRSVGKYTLQTLIGRGGMAEVYKSRHPELGRDLAIKILHPHFTDTPGFIERFRREAQAAAALRHPNIVQIYDFDVTADGIYYMVMEFIEGMALEKYLAQQKGAMPPEAALPLFLQIVSAVHFAHQKGTIHRDIKPANILIDPNEHIYLADFGIAQIVGASRLTESGVSTGTPAFMAPEQVLGQEITPAVDIYALGVILYQMLTGRLPYEGANPATLMILQATEPPTPPSRFADIPLRVEDVILRALAKEPENRFKTAKEMAEALTTAVTGPGTGSTPTLSQTVEPAPTLVLGSPATMAGATAVSPTPTDGTPAAPTQFTPIPQRTPPWVWAIIGIAALALIFVGFLLARGNGGDSDVATPAATEAAQVVVVAEATETETATAVPLPTDTSVPPTDTPEPTPTPFPVIEGMSFIPAGQFMMGSDEGNNDEQPIHAVSLDAFFIDTTEVTNDDFAAFVTETGATAPDSWRQPDPSLWQVTASEPYIVGGFADQFDFEGDMIEPSSGTLSMTVDADNDTGLITATFEGVIRPSATITEVYTGTFRIVQDVFSPGTSRPAFKEGGLADFVDMHGNSGNEFALYPELVAYIGTWGTADLYLDDELLFENLGIHIMYSDGVRHEEHYVRRADGSCCFSQSAPGDSFIDPDEQEISIWLFPRDSVYETLDDFWINIYYNEVTVIEAPAFSGPPIYEGEIGDHPVTGVNWLAANSYCEWRGARLPTEAEWEYAARGEDGRFYPWGSDPRGARANINNSLAGTAPVGSFPESASPFGVLDMAGNVWEWTADGYDPAYYAVSPAANPPGSADVTMRVTRGGGFRLLDFTGLDEARATHRRPLPPLTTSDDLGFRCALSLADAETAQSKFGPAAAHLAKPAATLPAVNTPTLICALPLRLSAASTQP